MLEQLQTRLAAYYVDHSTEQSVSIGPLVALTSGWASGVYRFTIGAADPAACVLKTYAATPPGRATAVREWQALKGLGAVNYPVPRVTHFESDETYLGRPFIVMEQAPGAPLWNSFERADGPTQERITDAFVGALVALHALDPRVLVPTLTQAQPYAFIDQELEGLRESSQRSSHATLIDVVVWLERHKHVARCDQPVILHRDYHPWNVLLDANDRLTVIDWDWSIGDFRFDLAWTSMLMRRSNFDTFSDAVEAHYARQSARPLNELPYFKIVTTLRWLLNVTYAVQSPENLRDQAGPAFKEFLVEPVRHALAFLHDNTGVAVEVRL